MRAAAARSASRRNCFLFGSCRGSGTRGRRRFLLAVIGRSDLTSAGRLVGSPPLLLLLRPLQMHLHRAAAFLAPSGTDSSLGCALASGRSNSNLSLSACLHLLHSTRILTTTGMSSSTPAICYSQRPVVITNFERDRRERRHYVLCAGNFSVPFRRGLPRASMACTRRLADDASRGSSTWPSLYWRASGHPAVQGHLSR